jgi:hypothetical protein
MTTQTFASPSFGSLARTIAALPVVIASAVADSISWFSPQRARAELLRMADSHARTDPAYAARLRKAATANWYGEA